MLSTSAWKLCSFGIQANFHLGLPITWCSFKMSFSRTVHKAKFASLETQLLGIFMSHAGCFHPYHNPPFIAHLYLSFMYIYAKASYKLECLSLWIFSVMETYWKDSRRAVIVSDPLVFLILLFRLARDCLFHRRMVLTEKCSLEIEGLVCYISLKIYFICILIIVAKMHEHELLRILTVKFYLHCFCLHSV